MSRHLACLLSISLSAAIVSGCSNPADESTEAIVSEAVAIPEPTSPAADSVAPDETSPAAAAVAPSANTLAILPADSSIGFVGSKVTGSHEGGFKTFNGTFTLSDDGTSLKTVVAEIDMDSTWSDNDRLTGHLKAPDFFDVAVHPHSQFVSTEITEGGEKGATHTIKGNLTLHGVTKSITFPATVEVKDGTATLTSDFFINRKDFGIEYAGKTDDLIRDEVVIKLALKASGG